MSSPRRIRPHQFEPVDATGDPLIDAGTYGAVFDGDRFVGWGEAGGGSGGTIVYGQTNQTHTIARNATGGNTWEYQIWSTAHHQYMRVLSFAMDIHTADTYTLAIDGEDVASVVAGSGGGVAATFTLSSPKVLTPGTHTWKIRGTAARTFYYNNNRAPAATGTYTSGIIWGPQQGVTVSAFIPGTLTFDAEGVLT